MGKPVVIRFEGPEEWEDARGNVDSILEKHTGRSDFPSTRSLPPIIIGGELEEDAIEELRELNGVVVDVMEE